MQNKLEFNKKSIIVVDIIRYNIRLALRKGVARNVMPTYALQWRAMQIAKAHKCLEYDMFGNLCFLAL